MHRLAAPLLLALAALSPLAAIGPPAKPDPALALDARLIAGVKKSPQIMTNLTYLSDEIGPRLTGSAAMKRANEWAAEKMKKYGLSNVELEAWTIPEGWQRGKAVARIIEPDNGRALTLASMAWYPGTKGKITADVVVLKGTSAKELAEYKGKLKGAVVLASPPVKLLPVEKLDPTRGPTSRAFEMAGGGGKGGGGRGGAFAARDFVAKEGAAALLLDSGKPFGLTVTTGGWQGKDRPSASNRIPTLYVAHNHYQLLHRLGTRPGARTRIELEVENTFVPGPIKVFNTIGEIVGSEKPDEVVVVGAHLDSWDLGSGTTDNGTGSCVVLEAARVLASCGVKPKRTIRFMLFTGEEQGLHGSRYHVTKNRDNLDKFSACLVHDTGTGKVRGIGGGGRKQLLPILQRELVSLKELGVTTFGTGVSGGSDHASFDRAGVPGLMMMQEPAGYPFTHHTPADTIDAAKEENLIQGAQVMAVAAMRIANLDEVLPRVERGGFGKGKD